MILWAKAEAIQQVNNQRVEVIELIHIEDERFPKIKVQLCGQPEVIKIISPKDICGVEIGDFDHNLAIFFEAKRYASAYTPPKPISEPIGPVYTIAELANMLGTTEQQLRARLNLTN